MTNNKSIDGLTTHAAKKSAAKSKIVKKSPMKRPKAVKKPVVDITNLEIEVKEDISTPKVATSAKEESTTEVDTPKITETTAVTETTTQDDIIKTTQTVEDFLTPVEAFNFEQTEKAMQASPKEKSKKELKQEKKLDKKFKKAEKKSHKVRNIVASICLVIVLLLGGFITWAVLWGNDIIAKITGGQGNIVDLLTFIDETYDPLKTDTNGRTNILAFGTEGYDMNGDVGNGVHDGAQLTDSIMLISLNQDTGDIAMVSLPRDLYAGNTCTATGKINEIYWCNNQDDEDEEAGATALMAEVGSILGVDIQYYAHLNWGSLIAIIDILGNIEVTLDEDIADYYYTGAVYEAGVTYTINGEEALGLARARHGTAGGDFTRGASQQKIIIGIKNKILEKDLSITDLVALAGTLGDNLRTNFSVSELKSLAHLTWEFDFDSMRTISLWPDYMTTGNINGISYVLPFGGAGNYGAVQAYVAKMLSNDPRVYEDATIAILNATDTTGLASDERLALENDGYTITFVGNAETGEFKNKHTLYVRDSVAPGTVDLLERHYHTTANSMTTLPAGLTADYDIIIVLGPSATDEETNN